MSGEAEGALRPTVRELVEAMLTEASDVAEWVSVQRGDAAPEGHWARSAPADDPRWLILRRSRRQSQLVRLSQASDRRGAPAGRR